MRNSNIQVGDYSTGEWHAILSPSYSLCSDMGHQRHSWFLESRIEDLKYRIYQESHKHIMNTYLPCIMLYAKLMVGHPRLYIVGVALKWKKKKLSYNAGIRINSQELCHDYDKAGMGKDLCSCRARPHLLQPSAATLQICYSNLRWKYPALQGISHVSKGLQNQGCGGMPWMKC